ncbi:unnamed protein product [Ostreobium quekettii]|uniref:TraB domain-containing protein n=1 Tax=Ostreobium quekettii TaxID=121088 RepID=A0A8S1IZB0_9CHLO|nr:unnamed protein product [Ostreobium quekettii]
MLPTALRGLATQGQPVAHVLRAFRGGARSSNLETRLSLFGSLRWLDSLSAKAPRSWICGEQGQTPGRQSCTARNASSSSLLCNTSSYLRNAANGAEIFLIGTAHISKKSAEEVKETINFVKPDVVMVELCHDRAIRLRSGRASTFGDLLAILLRPLTEGGFDPQKFGASLSELFLKSFYK